MSDPPNDPPIDAPIDRLIEPPIDFRLCVLIDRDGAFTGAIEDFMAANFTAERTEHMRTQLMPYVEAFFNTSQSLFMQEILVMLHNNFDLDGLINPEILANIQANVRPVFDTRYVAQNAQQTAAPEPLTQTAPAPPITPQRQFEDMPMEEVAAQQETQSPAQRPATHPVHSSSKIIGATDTNWQYVCDLCAYRVTYRNEFHRHFKWQGLRAGFKVNSTNVNTTPEKWYGGDSAGNKYMGLLVPYSSGGNDMHFPCKDRASAGRALAKANAEAKKAERDGKGVGKEDVAAAPEAQE